MVDKILKEREETHGDFAVNSKVMQVYKRQIRDIPTWNGLTFSKKESLDMIIHKLARILCGDATWLDSWYDIQGYTQLIINQSKHIDIDSQVLRSTPGDLMYTSPNAKTMDSLLFSMCTSIMDCVFLATCNPSSISPWKKIIDYCEIVIEYLEGKDLKSIQR